MKNIRKTDLINCMTSIDVICRVFINAAIEYKSFDLIKLAEYIGLYCWVENICNDNSEQLKIYLKELHSYLAQII